MSDDAARAWALPSVAGPVVASRSRSANASDLSEQARLEWQRAFQDARQLGYEAGMRDSQLARAELDRTIASVRDVLAGLSRSLLDSDMQLLDELTQLSLTIGKQLARRELQLDPAQVTAIVREAIALLPTNSRDVRVFLHPADAAVLRERLAAVTDGAWQILEDPVMARGGCRVESEFARIDSRFESRVAAIAAALLDPQAAAT